MSMNNLNTHQINCDNFCSAKWPFFYSFEFNVLLKLHCIWYGLAPNECIRKSEMAIAFHFIAGELFFIPVLSLHVQCAHNSEFYFNNSQRLFLYFWCAVGMGPFAQLDHCIVSSMVANKAVANNHEPSRFLWFTITAFYPTLGANRRCLN